MNGSEHKPGTPAAINPTHFLWPATAVLLLAAVMRLAWLSDVPPGLSQDEVLNADIATFIRQGEQSIFFSHGYGHEPLYHYFTVPFQVLLGDNLLAIRLPAVFLGLLLVAITMRWARRDFSLVVALVGGIGLAISWWPIIFSRVGLRPILEPFLLVLAVYLWPRRPWLAGLFLGLSVYSYTAARTIFLLPLAMLLYLLLFHRRRDLPFRSHPHSWDNPRTALIVFLISFALYIPLAVTLQLNPGLQQRVDQLSEPLTALGRGDIQPVWQTIRATLGVFSFSGDPRWTYSLPGRPLFEPLTALLFYGGLAMVFWRWRRSKYALLILWFGLAVLPSAITPDAPSTVRLVGIMPLVYLMPGFTIAFFYKWGLARHWRWKPGNGPKVVFPLLLAILVIITGLNLWRTAQDGFIRWPQELEARVKYQSVLQDMARYWEQNPVSRLVIAESFFEPIDAASFRRSLGQDPGTRWVQSGQDVAGAVTLPAGDGEGRLYVPEYAPPPATLLEAAGISQKPVYRSPDSPSFAVYELPNRAPTADHRIGVTFEDTFTLSGYSVLEKSPEQIGLATFWQLEAPVTASLAAADVAIFTHLVSGDLLLSQHDGLDVALATLQPGDLFIQYHVLPLAETLPSEPLVLEVGLYQRSDNRRLEHAGFPADRILLDFD